MTFDDKSFFVSIYEKLMEILLPLFETNWRIQIQL
jgi:hypothetical protein